MLPNPPCAVCLLCCRKQVAGQIPTHLASQMKPQLWTEAVVQCFKEVQELSAVEAKRKYIGNPLLAQTAPCPSCCLLSLRPPLPPCLHCRCCQLLPTLRVTFLPCHGGQLEAYRASSRQPYLCTSCPVCLSSCRAWPTPSSQPRPSLQSTRTMCCSWTSRQR